LAKQSTTAVATSKDSGFSSASAAKPQPDVFVPVGQRDKDTIFPIIRAHILAGTRVMSDMWKAYDCLKVNHSLNFVDPNTGAHTQRIENTWWEVKRNMLRTRIYEDLLESYLQAWLWLQQYGDDPFGYII